MAGRNSDMLASSLANNKAFQALEFHAARVREKAGEIIGDDQHNRILDHAADVAHKNISLWNASTVLASRFHVSEVREMNAASYQEVEEFEDDDEPAGELAGQQAGMASAVEALKPGFASHPVIARSYTASSRHPALEAAKGASNIGGYDADEDRSVGSSAAKQEIINLRGKSFLARPDLEGSTAVDMLAQLRGAKWQSNSITAAKSAKSMTPVERSGASVRATMRRHDSATAGGVVHDLPWAASKSFTSNKRPSALPDVSVHEDYGRPSPRSSGGPASGGFGKGLMSRLKGMLK